MMYGKNVAECGVLGIENRGFETVRIYGDIRRIATVDSNVTRYADLCGIVRLDRVRVSSIGGRQEFYVDRLADTYVEKTDTLFLVVGAHEGHSHWVR